MSRGSKTKVRRKNPPPPAADRAAEPILPDQVVEPSQPWWRQNWVLGLLLVLATLFAYQPVWHAGFIWDDDEMLTDNPLVKSVRGLFPLWFTASTPDYYPMTSSMLLVEWQLWGDRPLGYHLVNVLLHAGSAVFWWRILRRLEIPGAWLAAAIFALHPVNVESVAWIAERKNTLCMLFYSGALWSWLRFEDSGLRRWYALSLAAFILALLSKTAVSPLPVVLLVLAWWRRGRVGRQDVQRTMPFFVAAAALALVTIWFQAHKAIGHEIVRTDSFMSRLAGAGWAIWFYLYKAVLPFNLIFVYPRWAIDPKSAWSYGPLLLSAAIFSWCWRHRQSWGRRWLFAMAYFVLLLLPILGFINIYFMRYSLVADHWQYFAIMAPIALVAAGVRTDSGRFWKSSAARENALCGALLLLLGALTWNQCRIYADSETLWQATEERNPDSVVVWINLGQLSARSGDSAKAVTSFQKALEISPDNPDAHNNLGYALVNEGQIPEAIEQYQKAVALQPNYAEFHSNLGTALAKAKRTEEAIGEYQKALALEPNSAEMHCNLGALLVKAGRKEEAAPHFQTALKIRPNYAQTHFDLGLECAARGQMDEAGAHFRMATELDPNDVEAFVNLGNSLMGQWQLADAIVQFREALKLNPDEVDAANNLALILATASDSSLRDGAEALRLAERADQIEGGKDLRVLATLAAAYGEVGRIPEAVDTAQRALRLSEAQSNSGMTEPLQAQLKSYRAGLPYHGLGKPR